MDKQQVTAGPSNQQPSNLSIQRKKSTTQVLRRKASSVYSRITDASTITTYSIATTDVASSSLQIEEMLRELGHLQASAEGGVKVSEAPKAAEDRPPSRTQVSERASVAHNVLRVPQSLGAVGPALKQRPIPESSKDAVPTMGRDKGKAAEHVVHRWVPAPCVRYIPGCAPPSATDKLIAHARVSHCRSREEMPRCGMRICINPIGIRVPEHTSIAVLPRVTTCRKSEGSSWKEV